MDALFALACTLPPSAALVAGAFVWLQRERDRRVNDQHLGQLSINYEQLRNHDAVLVKQDERLMALEKRAADAEQQLSRLTDRLHA